MSDILGMTPDQHNILRTFLHRYIPGVAVWAYGSRVKGTARPYSDLDLVLFMTPKERFLVSELKESLDESNLPFLVDLLIWDELSSKFHQNIKEKYIVVQEGQTP
ncbi:MAG: nucleotidyltransferase domain-containing protein [Magnetococcus sp. DMHC-6]